MPSLPLKNIATSWLSFVIAIITTNKNNSYPQAGQTNGLDRQIVFFFFFFFFYTLFSIHLNLKIVCLVCPTAITILILAKITTGQTMDRQNQLVPFFDK